VEWRYHCAGVWIGKDRLGVKVALTSPENVLSDAAGRTVAKHSGSFQAVESCLANLAQCSALLKMGKLAFIVSVPI